MTAFEYITIPVSIILALGLGKVLTTVMVVVETGKRNWLHLLWCVVLMLVMLSHWVQVWTLHSNEIWSAAEFFIVMISPILFYAAAHLLVSSRPESIVSWSSHLEQIARPFLFLMALTMGNFFLRNLVILDDSVEPTNLLTAIIAVGPVGFSLVTLAYPKRFLLAATAVIWLLPVIGTLRFAELR